MVTVKTKQLIVIAGTIVIIVLLLFATTRLPKKDEEAALSRHTTTDNTGVGINALVTNAKKGLTTEQRQKTDQLEKAIETSSDKNGIYKNLVAIWDSLRQSAVAAYFMEQAAVVSSTEKNWEEAGKRYYVSTQFSGESDRPMLYEKAIDCFEKTLKINPSNVEAKINLAACYVEGTSDPMKGITMLREIEKTDSNNVNLQLSFAFFSEKSGQWDKAIARFNKILKIQPDFIEAYLHLADAYERKGDKEAAIESLTRYMNQVDDITIKTEVQNYINQLSTQDNMRGETKKQ